VGLQPCPIGRPEGLQLHTALRQAAAHLWDRLQPVGAPVTGPDQRRGSISYLEEAFSFRRESGERGLANCSQEDEMRLSLFVTMLALALATVAGQSALI
jgi:hypothetical protein